MRPGSWPPPGRGHRKPAARGPGSRAGFGATWWGRAWVEALEQRARLDPNRLPRGRGYARSGAVGELVVSAGEVRAAVQGTRRTPYDVRVRVRVFAPAEWDRVLDAVGAQLGHSAALLDGELPPAVADDVRAAGLDLLPGAGEVGPRCSCPDDADPCNHSAAVCYLVGRRCCTSTRPRERRSIARACSFLPPTRPVGPGSWPRGWGDGGLGISAEADLARRSCGVLGTPQFAPLAARAGLPERELARWALAWREGGADGLSALRERWVPPAEDLAEGRAAFAAAGMDVHVRAGRLTAGEVQLRLGRDGLWYRFRRRFGNWELDGPPQPDPRRLLDFPPM